MQKQSITTVQSHARLPSTLLSTLLIIVLTCALFASMAYSNRLQAASLRFETATFAGGCFWCTEADLEKAPGVLSAVSGYAGGDASNANYQAVSSGSTQHIEAVQVTYDPALISYKQLLDYFWRNIDPTDAGGQFVDRGPQYRPAIFIHNKNQQVLAQQGLNQIKAKFSKPLAVELIAYTTFYPAEEYHQDYYKKNNLKYSFYRNRSGRDEFIQAHWDSPPAHYLAFRKPPAQELKQKLGEIAYEVTQKDGTERPFDNAYWDNKKQGIYVDVVSGEPLFSSTHKFKSGTGWPSFTQPIVEHYITEEKDFKLFSARTEIRSKLADSHLGHVFDDGPAPTGLRYCINSAALRFIAKENMTAQGYGHYLSLFEMEKN